MIRTRVASGIYEDRYGLAATVKVGRIQREKRFPAGTALETMRSWQTQTRAILDGTQEKGPAPVRGTLEQDGERFLKRKRGMPSADADRAHLKAWFPKFGSWLRSRITREDCERQIHAWFMADVAARTIRHRVRVLRECYRVLDGPRAKTPVDQVKLPKIPAPRPVAVPTATIQAVAVALARSAYPQTYARFLVRWTTGQRPTQVMRAEPADVDFQRKLWFVRSAKGGTPIVFPLTPEAVKAWKLFARVEAWGAYDTTRDAQILREHGWPAEVRPYALRSTFAIDLLLKGGDLGQVQGLLGHQQIQTTRSHYAPVQTALLRGLLNKRKLRLPATTSRTTSRDYQPTPTDLVSFGKKTTGRTAREHAAKTRQIG